MSGSGAICATADGGKTWSKQPSSTGADLTSVQFLADGQRGWAVGDEGTILLLETRDFSPIRDAKTPEAYSAALRELMAEAPRLAEFHSINQKMLETIAGFDLQIATLQEELTIVLDSL